MFVQDNMWIAYLRNSAIRITRILSLPGHFISSLPFSVYSVYSVVIKTPWLIIAGLSDADQVLAVYEYCFNIGVEI